MMVMDCIMAIICLTEGLLMQVPNKICNTVPAEQLIDRANSAASIITANYQKLISKWGSPTMN